MDEDTYTVELVTERGHRYVEYNVDGDALYVVRQNFLDVLSNADIALQLGTNYIPNAVCKTSVLKWTLELND